MIHWSPANENPKEFFGVHLPAGIFSTDWHEHPKHQLLYSEGGVLQLQTEKKHLILPAKHGAWIPAHHSHKIYSKSSRLYLHTLYFHERSEDDEILRQFHIFPITRLAREMILHTAEWPSEGNLGSVERKFFEVIRLLASDWCQEPMPLVLPTTDESPLKEVTSYIQEHLNQPLQLEAVAEKFGYSGRTLLRLFKEQLGMTFGSYLRIVRIRQAIELLTDTSASITEVAYDVGYQSLSSFSKVFQQYTGIRPKDYKGIEIYPRAGKG